MSPKLLEIYISEKFSADIEGESPVRALQVQRDDKSASMVRMQRFSGRLGGRQGASVLQGTETIAKGRSKATWFVVPRSGTGDLSGLRGDGGFEGEFEKESDGWLDYWFECFAITANSTRVDVSGRRRPVVGVSIPCGR